MPPPAFMFSGGLVVLTIGKLGTSRGRLEYYDAQVAAGAEDYYAGRGESPGRWRGTGATALGLGPGRVSRREFLDLVRGRNPTDGSILRTMGAKSTVSGFDLTFSAPKSVSVLFAIDDEHVGAEIRAAHERAVDTALSYLEGEACWTRRGRDGVDRVRGEGFVAASYRHRMSRAGDPQLHTHVVVANMTCADGRYTALDARSIYQHKSAGGAVYRAVLRAEVRRRLPWLSWRATGRGLFELEGMPDVVLRHFSQRRAEIEERATKLVGAGIADELSRERMQRIALATRKAKTYGVDGATWAEESRARAAEHGLGTSELEALRVKCPVETSAPDMPALTARLSGPAGLTGEHNTFARRHALAEIAGAFTQGATLAEIELSTDTYLGDEGVARLSQGDAGELRFTTHELLAREREIIDGTERRSAARTGVLPVALVNRALADTTLALNNDQATVVRVITSSGRGIEVVNALAGTGKTTMLGIVATAYRDAGWHVVGAAPTARAARQLRDTADIRADTMHSLLAQLERTGGLDQKTVLVLDEAGMAPTRRSAQLLAHAELAGAKVIAVGDPGQLGAVEAGGWMAAITRREKSTALREVMRQRDPDEQRALEALHEGDASSYLEHKHDAIAVHETEIDGLMQVTDSWYAAQLRHGPRDAVMIARDNLTRERLNRAARAKLKQDGLLPEHGVIIGGREYSLGDRVIARRNDRRRNIDNGSSGTIIAINETTGSMIIETDSGHASALDAGYVADHLQHAYALTAHGAQGATVEWAGVIGRASDYTREWAYTSLSRARGKTTLHVISERSTRDRERDEYAPPEPDPSPQRSRQALLSAMQRPETEPLAAEHTPPPTAHTRPPTRTARPVEPNGLDLLRSAQRQRSQRSLRL